MLLYSLLSLKQLEKIFKEPERNGWRGLDMVEFRSAMRQILDLADHNSDWELDDIFIKVSEHFARGVMTMMTIVIYFMKHKSN